MSDKKDNSDRPVIAMWIIMLGFVILFLILSLTGCAQEPDLEGYSVEAWQQNNAEWQLKLDSVASLNDQNCDSLKLAAQGWYEMYLYAEDTSIKVGDHYFEVHDTVTGNWSKITTKGDEVWLTYYNDSLRYHFWVIDRGENNKHFEFWIGNGNEASNIIRMDTSQFRIDYKDLNKYFK